MSAIRSKAEVDQQKEAELAAEHEAKVTEDLANRELEVTKSGLDRKLAANQISLSQWEQQEIAALNRWRSEQEAAYNQLLARLRALGLQDEQIYKNVLDAKVAMERKADDDIVRTHQQAVQKMEQQDKQLASLFSQNTNAMLRGQQSFAQSAINIYNSIAEHFVDDLITRMVQQWGLGHLLMETEDKVFAALHLGVQTTMSAADTAAVATNNARNVAEADSAAALAAANTFAWYSATFPPAAPGMAAAALAEGQAFAAMAAFEMGTDFVPRTGLAILHEGEAVTPATDMRSFRTTLNSIANNSRSNKFVNTFHNYGGETAQMTEAQLSHMVRRAAARNG
jgi:hypothetical protein